MKVRLYMLGLGIFICLLACEKEPSGFTATIDEKYSFEADYCKAEKDVWTYNIYGFQGKSAIEFKLPNHIQGEGGCYHYWGFDTTWTCNFKYTPNTEYPNRYYKGSTGSLRFGNVADKWIQGSFMFWCVNSLNANDSITIWGEYDRVPY